MGEVSPSTTDVFVDEITDDPSVSGYGYTPAVAAIIERLKDAFTTRCLPRKLAKTDDGGVACKLVEATFPAAGEACDCNLELRADPEATLASAVRRQLHEKGSCGTPGRPSCADVCLCQIGEPRADGLEFCQHDVGEVSPSPAWCYIDEPTNPLVRDCPASERQLLRLVSSETVQLPRNGAILSIACLGAPTVDTP